MTSARTITLAAVSGMRTEHCKRAVFTALSAIEGIVRADVQLGSIQIEHDGSVTEAQLCDAIAVTGYQVTGTTLQRRRVLPISPE
jgi:copper chaperone CopZ